MVSELLSYARVYFTPLIVFSIDIREECFSSSYTISFAAKTSDHEDFFVILSLLTIF